jgi:NAD(P)H-hydrate repair Nnr-like enzyme with NAD(P)H-hydrate epimerase domain
MVLAGAVRGVAQATAGAARGAPPAAPPAAGGGSGSGDAFEAARILQQEGQSFNLRYLELQERLQRETREFTALSNVMKVRHDAARAAIQNVQ